MTKKGAICEGIVQRKGETGLHWSIYLCFPCRFHLSLTCLSLTSTVDITSGWVCVVWRSDPRDVNNKEIFTFFSIVINILILLSVCSGTLRTSSRKVYYCDLCDRDFFSFCIIVISSMNMSFDTLRASARNLYLWLWIQMIKIFLHFSV